GWVAKWHLAEGNICPLESVGCINIDPPGAGLEADDRPAGLEETRVGDLHHPRGQIWLPPGEDLPVEDVQALRHEAAQRSRSGAGRPEMRRTRLSASSSTRP